MLVLRIKKEQNVVGEIKYSVNDLKKLGVNIENMANKEYWNIVVDCIAQAIFKSYEDVNSVFAFDTKYKDLTHVTEIFNSKTVKDKVEIVKDEVKEENYPDYYDWDYEPTAEELYGEPIECEEF